MVESDKLCLTASTGTKSMLAVHKDGMLFQMRQDVANEYMFLELTAERCEFPRTVITWIVHIPFLVNGCDICLPPISWHLTLLQTFVEDYC